MDEPILFVPPRLDIIKRKPLSIADKSLFYYKEKGSKKVINPEGEINFLLLLFYFI
ncbi:hypothetical protein FH5_04906 [Priestia endophytica]|jgi:hypothetical protein|nr:hypothetical protein FH5_04906 [Priestia endophytica]